MFSHSDAGPNHSVRCIHLQRVEKSTASDRVLQCHHIDKFLGHKIIRISLRTKPYNHQTHLYESYNNPISTNSYQKYLHLPD
ncbi:unnamed protein product [Auanema sp. JU1783]|nr:unnamed protein product [Auanema sp. JU1783]